MKTGFDSHVDSLDVISGASARLSGVRVRPYARLGFLGPRVGCSFFLMALAAAAVAIGAMW